MTDIFAHREAIFFDFDGVLVDSVAVKTCAFRRLYEHEGPKVAEAVTAYHLENGGMSRFKKFEHYERVLLRREPSAARIAELGHRFAELVVEEVVSSPEIPGAGALLKRLSAEGVPCYVVSGTPEDELHAIVAQRGMTRFFRAVRGSPAEKATILAELLAAHGHRASKCVMVGDALGDHEAAVAVEMDFLGVAPLGDLPFPHGTRVVSCFRPRDLQAAA